MNTEEGQDYPKWDKVGQKWDKPIFRKALIHLCFF